MKPLSKNKNSNPFKVPENYFEELNEKIIARSFDSKTVEKSWRSISLKPFISLAAVIAGAALITIAIISTLPSEEKQRTTLAEAASEYADLEYNNIDILMIETALAEISLSEENQEVISDDEIIEYLLSGQVEISLLYEHLGGGIDM